MSLRPPSGRRTSCGTPGNSTPLAVLRSSSPSQCSQDGDDLPATPGSSISEIPPSPMQALTPRAGGLSSPLSAGLASGLGSLVGDACSMTPEMVHLKDLVSLRDTPPEAREDWQVQRILALALGREGCGLQPRVPGEEGASWSIIKGAPVNLQAALARQVVVQLVKGGRKIMTEGQRVFRSYFIVHGEVAVKETFGKPSADARVEQPFHLRTIGPGSAFGDLPKGPRETPRTSPKIVAKTDLIIFYVEHDKYWKLVQGQKEADEQARRRTLLSSLYPVWGDAGDEAAQHKRDYEILKTAAKLKLKSLQPGETLIEQGQQIAEIYFVVSGEIHITVDLELVEIYPGSVKKIEERRSWQEKKVEAAKGVSHGASSESQDRLSTRIEFSQSLTPRQLGLVRDCQLKLGCACPGDSIGDSHLWKDYPTYKHSAIASTVAEVAYMSVQAFKDCPSRFLLLRYKASELNVAETRDILARLLRIEALDGWKPSIPTDDLVPHLPTKMPAWLGQHSSVASRAQLKPSSIRMKNDDKEAWLDNPEGLHRKLLFHTASQSMTALTKNADKQPAPEPVPEDEFVSSLEYQLLFGGRDNLRDKQWHPYTPRQQETPRAHEPYQHPRARPATAPEPWWKREKEKEPSFVDEERINKLKPVFNPRNASISLDPYRRPRPPKKKSVPLQPAILKTLSDPNGATLEPLEPPASRAVYMAPRQVHRRRL